MLLGELATRRDNNFQLIRLAAAAAVVVFHSFALLQRAGQDPLARTAGTLDLGALGVHAFFFISGLLVTKTFIDRRSVPAFAAARALRVYPALACATLLGIVLAASSSPLRIGEFLLDSRTVDYALHNATGWSLRDALPGAFASNPYPRAVNGSLWTLPIELRFYVAIAAFGVVGLLVRKRVYALVVAAAAAAVVVDPSVYPIAPNIRATHYLGLLFALGSLAYVWRDRIPLSLAAAALAATLIAWNPGRWAPGALYCAALGYVLLVVAYHPRLRVAAASRIGDYSYGLYVYSFPIQQTVIESLPQQAQQPLTVLALSLPLAFAAAFASWHLVEKRALSRKPSAGASLASHRTAAMDDGAGAAR